MTPGFAVLVSVTLVCLGWLPVVLWLWRARPPARPRVKIHAVCSESEQALTPGGTFEFEASAPPPHGAVGSRFPAYLDDQGLVTFDPSKASPTCPRPIGWHVRMRAR